MRPKEYLSQIELMDKRIKWAQHELDALLKEAYSPKSPTLDVNKVRTSMPNTSKVEDIVIKYQDKADDLNQYIDTYVDTRHKIMQQIRGLDNSVYIDILMKRYIEYKRLEQIACEMCYSFDRIRHLHGEALQKFGELYLSTQ